MYARKCIPKPLVQLRGLDELGDRTLPGPDLFGHDERLEHPPTKQTPTHGGHRVIEVDRKGKIVWTYKCSSPMDADRLPDGNTLIVQYSQGVLLVSPAGKLLQKFKVAPSYDIKRLPDGTMLVTGNDGLRKYDAKGTLLWTRKIGVTGSIEVY